jgi:hypothetical protein
MIHFLLTDLRKVFRFLIAIAMGIFAYLGIGLIGLTITLAKTIIFIPLTIVFFLLGTLCMSVTFLIAVACGALTPEVPPVVFQLGNRVKALRSLDCQPPFPDFNGCHLADPGDVGWVTDIHEAGSVTVNFLKTGRTAIVHYNDVQLDLSPTERQPVC